MPVNSALLRLRRRGNAVGSSALHRFVIFLACLGLLVAVGVAFYVVVVPPGIHWLDVGQSTVGLERFDLSFYHRHRIRLRIQLPLVTIAEGIPSAMVIGGAIQTRLRRNQRHTGGFPVVKE